MQIYIIKLIDFNKAKGKNVYSTSIVDNPLLPFVLKNVSVDGEILKSKKTDSNGKPIYKEPYKVAEFNNILIGYTEKGNYRVSGSFHKYWNKGLHNFNDFSEKQFKETLVEFCNKFSINPKECKLENLEVGINFTPPIKTNNILDWCLLHSTKSFESKYDNNYGRFIQCVHSQYIIKTYNKALQYSSKGYKFNEQIMRFEIKFTAMEKLNKLGIYSYYDLLNFDFNIFKTMLLKEWDKILLIDYPLNCSEKLKFQYSNPLYWKELLNRNSKSAYYKHRNKLNEIISHNPSNLKKEIREIMINKIDTLIT
jgi:hypothetical protein